jgi:hypothetical protein
MLDANLIIYTLSALVAFLTLILTTRMVQKKNRKRVNPWKIGTPSSRNRSHSKERISQPSEAPAAHLFRQR